VNFGIKVIFYLDSKLWQQIAFLFLPKISIFGANNKG